MRGRFASLAVGAGALALGLTLAGCKEQKVARAPCPAGKICLERGNVAEPISLDPGKITGTWEDFIVSDMIVGLTQNDIQGNMIPGMATSWETSPDGLTWTFHLRDAKWSDGVPVTSADFVAGLQHLLDPKEAADYASLVYMIKNAEPVNSGKMPVSALGVEAPDPHTFVIHLDHPAPYMAELATHQTMYPVPKHMLDKWGDNWSKPPHYVSNGPYTLVDWKLGDNVHLTKNPLFWEASKVCIDEVRYYPTVDSIAAERRVLRGELDLNADYQSNRLAHLRETVPAYVHNHTYLGVDYLAFNTTIPKFKDRRVRLALSMIVDRDFVTKKLTRGGNVTAYTFVPPGVANYDQIAPPDWASIPFDQRIPIAKKLLADAGYGPKNPLKVEITYRNSSSNALIMPAIQADWAAIGVKTDLKIEDTQIAYQDFNNKNFEIADAAWIADYNDVFSFLYLFKSDTGSNNYSGYNNPAYDALIDASDQEQDLKKREAILQKAEAMVQNDYPVATVWYTINKNLVSPKITGFVDNLVDKHRTRYMCLPK